MTKDEALNLLEEHDYCSIHFIKKERSKESRVKSCKLCKAIEDNAIMLEINKAIEILGGKSPANAELDIGWTPLDQQLPSVNEKVHFIVVGFRETGKPGHTQHYATGKPLWWKKIKS